MNRRLSVLAVATGLAVLALWVVPPLGFAAAAILLAVTPPWGRTVCERAIISGVVAVGLVAVTFPRAGPTPVTTVSARLMLTGLVLAALALRAVPRLREVRIPRLTLSDILVLALAIGSSLWLMSAYVGASPVETVSALFFSGWDNQGHFTTFANTYAVGSTTWPTADGSIAWNQWYPSLHTTIWSLAELAVNGGGLTRAGLLWPYVLWSSVSFALCLAVLAWLGGDIAARLGGRERSGRARPLAIVLVGIFGVLGSPAFLFNKGFTNFFMAVTVAAVTAYLSARSSHSARSIGWFLLPLGALVVIGLWTPLVLGLVPSGVVVALALLRQRAWLGGVWLAAVVVLGAVTAVTQSQAILGAEDGASATDFTTTLGSVGTGMAPFNVGAALVSPLVVALVVFLIVRGGRWRLAIAVSGPVLACLLLTGVFVLGADAANVGRLQSYYVLKCLDAMLLTAAPLTAAIVAVAAVRALQGLGRVPAVVSAAVVALLALGMFGYVGFLPTSTDGTLAVAPGVQAGADRTQGIHDSLVGEAIMRGSAAALPYPGYTTVLWDGAGLLPNLWVSSLTGVMSKNQNDFYREMPGFPYDAKASQYLDLSLNVDKDLRLVVLWFRPASGDALSSWAAQHPGRVAVQQVPMPSNPLCPEC